MKITVDLTTASLGEIEQFEVDSKMTWEEFTEGKSSIRGTMALICLQERRANPKYSMDDARKIKVGDVEFEEVAADPPTKRKPARAAS